MFFDLEQDERTAVKTAVALATSRYRDTIGKFVQGKPDRLSIVSEQVARIARECAEAAKADPEEVARAFEKYLAEVAVSEPEKQNVTDKAEYNDSDEVPQPERGVRDDIAGTDAVLDEDPAEHMEMPSGLHHDFISKEAGPFTQMTCPQCGHMMTPVQNPQNPAGTGQSQKCPNCGATVMVAPGTQGVQPQPGGILPPGQQAGGLYSKCARCEENDAEEASIFCVACNHYVLTGEKVVKEAQGDLEDPDTPVDDQVQSPAESDPNQSQQSLPPAVKQDTNGPAQVYTGIVQQTANQNAAMAWSTPGEDDYNKIAQQYGIDPDSVRKYLRIVADFGDALAVNGDPNGDPNMDGYTMLDGFGGSISPTEEEVDVDNAIQHTADRTNLSPDDVYALVKESYGGDLGGQHYVSVSGEAHYYLPDSLVPQQPQEPQQGQDVDSPNETPQQAMQSSVPAHLKSLTAYLEWEKAQLAHSDA